MAAEEAMSDTELAEILRNINVQMTLLATSLEMILRVLETHSE